MLAGLRSLPVLDAHTHLTGDHLSASGLHDVLLYHMVISDLYAVGCPNGARLTQFPGRPTEDEAERRLVEGIPFMARARNTSNNWMLRTILRDLYGWQEEVTVDNWRLLDGIVRERAGDRRWERELLGRMKIARSSTELSRRGSGQDDDRLQYAVEWGMFTRRQWGEFDTPLYELERCWGRPPGPPAPIGHGEREVVLRRIVSIEDVHLAMDHFVDVIPQEAIAVATHVSTDIDYFVPTDDDMAAALARRDEAGEVELATYASYLNEQLLLRLGRRESRLVFQFSFAAEPMEFETAARLRQVTLRHLGEMCARHPDVEFLCLQASRHADHGLCSLARQQPNLSLAGYWWHNFYPSSIRQIFEGRLDMLPCSRWVGFFSDVYSLEWSYAKLDVVLRQMAAVLADRADRDSSVWTRPFRSRRTCYLVRRRPSWL